MVRHAVCLWNLKRNLSVQRLWTDTQLHTEEQIFGESYDARQ